MTKLEAAAANPSLWGIAASRYEAALVVIRHSSFVILPPPQGHGVPSFANNVVGGSPVMGANSAHPTATALPVGVRRLPQAAVDQVFERSVINRFLASKS